MALVTPAKLASAMRCDQHRSRCLGPHSRRWDEGTEAVRGGVTLLPVDTAVIVGAGAFGASLAHRLARDGVRVTLVDQHPPGDPRASSGGETRLLRCAHGADADYARSARRARALWRELEAEADERLYEECGVAWFAHRPDGWEAASEATLAGLGIPAERADPRDLFPSVRDDDLAFTLLEPEAGVLRAQHGCRRSSASPPCTAPPCCGIGPSRRIAAPGSTAARAWTPTRWCGPAMRGCRPSSLTR